MKRALAALVLAGCGGAGSEDAANAPGDDVGFGGAGGTAGEGRPDDADARAARPDGTPASDAAANGDLAAPAADADRPAEFGLAVDADPSGDDRGGWGDDGDAGPKGARTRLEFEGQVEVNAQTPFDLDTPLGPGEALFVDAAGATSDLYWVAELTGPAGPLIGEPAGAGLSRTSPNPQVATALIPNAEPAPSPELLGAGRYTVRIAAVGGTAPSVRLRIFRVAGPGRALTVHVLVPAAAEFAGEAASLDAFAEALVERGAERLGLALTVETHPLPADAPAELSVDAAAGDLSGFADLARAAPPDVAAGPRVYLLDQIHDGANRIGGLSGGLPMPAVPGGDAASVVAVRARLLPDFPEAVADAAVHELGHALGLWHTTEADGERSDPIDDTPVCPTSCDADGDGALLAGECGRHDTGEPPCRGAADDFMFWTLGGDPRSTEGQRRVVARHPALTP